MNDPNPWVVENIEVFSFYCCPECDFKSKHGDAFKRHALESHNKSKSFFTVSSNNKFKNNTNNECMEVETEYQDKNQIDDGVNVIIQKYDPFENENINGTMLPLLATGDSTFIKQLGITNPIHRSKITLKAMDVVLFGPPKEPSNLLKEWKIF